MTTRHPLISRTLVVLGTAATLSGCGITDVCTLELRPRLVVEVRVRLYGKPAAQGVTAVSVHEGGALTEFTARDDLTLHGNWGAELPGNHTILVRKPGFLPDTVRAGVDADRCHVELETVEAEIAPDPRAAIEHPVSFIEEPHTGGWRRASAEVRVHGDTLEIRGLAHTRCTELRLVAFRSGSGLHVQVEPSDIPLEDCVDARRFEAKFTLPSEPTHLLVTNAHSFPVGLFDGQVRPTEGG